MRKLKFMQLADFITVGVYTAIYFCVIFATSMIGVVPILYIFLSIIVALIGGIPFILFLSKVKRFGMITLMSIIIGVITSLTGYSFLLLLFAIVFGLISDLLFNTLKVSKISYILTYTIYNFWMMGYYYPLFINSEKFFEYTRQTNGYEYASQLKNFFPSWAFIAIIVSTAIAAIIGGIIGIKMLQKHFNKAGI
ncbi:hypothetical protein HMPREF2580_10925 [Staphylococcus sp. HMSC036D05]|uniref:MptD family putative ECF transporter S component n=1 Tax=Staphylococcus sp. HMSC036D05 TaxID=1715059 RepID=UPI0008A94A36|nr:MptD family putative ECF transporter S component [Staphylococcus sp. HMSC036D05]OHO68052.1 hypothetical protein HMPREF2580_10925 [Staphylococcus sp. HMSC036D05]